MTTFDSIQTLFAALPEDSRNISYLGFTFLVLASALISIACSYLYLMFYDKNATGSKVYRAFPLMGPAITCIFLTVQFSLPLSLGLLGALSIVRFRTPIKEPEEIGFILLLIALALSIATFNLSFAIILYIVSFIALTFLKPFKGFSSINSNTDLLHIEVSESDLNGAEIADKIIAALGSKKIPSNLVTVNQQDEVSYITLGIHKNKMPLQPIFECVTHIFPAAIIHYNKA